MTRTESPQGLLEARYAKAAQDYLHSLPLEHFMESTPHATLRKITWDSLDLLAARRSDVHVFNELLVQYPLPRRKRLGQVVPDNLDHTKIELEESITALNEMTRRAEAAERDLAELREQRKKAQSRKNGKS